jgi:glycerol-3-phosphate acyltransferase PlsY
LTDWWRYVIVIVVSYFIGNINFSRIISKKFNTDITKQGSGNPGATNMLRTFGFKVGIATLSLDALKGVLAALLGFLLFGGAENCSIDIMGLHSSVGAINGLYIGGLSVIIGHNFPVIYKFKGGKGVACILGMYFVASPIIVAICFIFVFIYLYVFDYMAVASFIFISVLTFFEALKMKGNFLATILLFAIFTLTWFMHRYNIFRLLVGKENKANLKKSLRKLYSRKEIRAEKKEIKIEKKEDKLKDIG